MRPAAIATTTVIAAGMLVIPVLSFQARPEAVAPDVWTLPLSAARASVELDPAAATPEVGASAPVEVSRVVDNATEPFDLVAVTWEQGSGSGTPLVEVRVLEDGGWSEWIALEAMDEGPDAGTEEYANARGGTAPLLTDGAGGVEVRLTADAGQTPEQAQVELVDAGTSATDTALEQAPLASAAAAGRPGIISRGAWGADESLRGGSPSYMSTVDVAIIHHTATSNSYSDATTAAQIRSIYAYHTASLRWSDIGYNFLVDRFGRIYEGRAGGTDRAVQGAHSGGLNARTVGISALGNYEEAAAPAALSESIAQLIAWKLPLHGSDPRGTTELTSAGGGTARYSVGTTVSVKNVIGHRDVGFTACPGSNLYNRLADIRERASALAGAVVAGVGTLDSALGGTEKVDVSGWALRVGDITARTVTVSVDGADRGTLMADRARLDVQAVYPTNSANHGFSGSVPAPAGLVQVCARIAEPSVKLSLGCRPALVLGTSPVGKLTAANTDFGRVTVNGWALDGDATGPVDIHVYADGVGVGVGVANRAQSDVAALQPGRSAGFGFSLPLLGGSGSRDICAYAINAGGAGSTALLGCTKVSVDGSPRGSFESVSSAAGKVSVSGWLIDPDVPVSDVHVYVGSVGTALRTTFARADVAAAHPAFAGSTPGWSITVSAPPGVHQVCAYGINSGPGSTAALGCKSVTVLTGSPFGSFEAATSAAGKINVSGWVIDPDVLSTSVHVYVGSAGTALGAASPRTDVAAVYPAFSAYSPGFSGRLAATPGRHNVCAYGINSGSGGTLPMGCQTVDVLSGSPVGSFEAARPGPGSIDVSGWIVDPDVLSSDVHVYVDGVGTALRASTTRADVATVFPAFATYVHGWSGRLTASPGRHQVCGYGINSGPGGTLGMGCVTVTVPSS